VDPKKKDEKFLENPLFSGKKWCYNKTAGSESGSADFRERSCAAMGEKRLYFPRKVGMRNIKTATAAALCALVYFFLDRSPAFACIGANFGMGSDYQNSKLHGGNRLFGTLIGGLLGMALFRIYLFFYPDGRPSLLMVLLVFIGTVLLILLCQMFWVGGVQPGGVVLCIILFNTPVETYVSYALNRILDTGIGVVAALLVNSMFPGGFTFRWMEKMWKEVASPKPPKA